MEEFDAIDNGEIKKEQRPVFLTVLCVLSFVYLGFSILLGVIGLGRGQYSEDEILTHRVESAKAADEMRSLDMESLAVMQEQIQRMSESLNQSFYPSSILSLAVMLLGLWGVIWMWKGRKLGFHLYIAYSLLTIVQIYFFVSPADIPTAVVVWNMFFSAIFVVMYSRNLKWLS